MPTMSWPRRLGGGATTCSLLLALASGCATGRLPAPTREQVLQAILPSAVQVVIEHHDGRRLRSASGVVIAQRPAADGTDCFVLTSAHALIRPPEEAEAYVLFDRHRGAATKARAVVLARREAEGLDLALLRIRTGRCSAAPLGPPPTLGEAVWVVAFPWGRHMKLSGGIVSQVEPEAAGENGASRIMVDASVTYGSSGGGVYEARTGRLIGLVEGYGTASVSLGGDSPRSINVPVPGETYVTPPAAIRRFLDQAGYGNLLGDRRSPPRTGE